MTMKFIISENYAMKFLARGILLTQLLGKKDTVLKMLFNGFRKLHDFILVYAKIQKKKFMATKSLGAF